MVFLRPNLDKIRKEYINDQKQKEHYVHCELRENLFPFFPLLPTTGML